MAYVLPLSTGSNNPFLLLWGITASSNAYCPSKDPSTQAGQSENLLFSGHSDSVMCKVALSTPSTCTKVNTKICEVKHAIWSEINIRTRMKTEKKQSVQKSSRETHPFQIETPIWPIKPMEDLIQTKQSKSLGYWQIPLQFILNPLRQWLITSW